MEKENKRFPFNKKTEQIFSFPIDKRTTVRYNSNRNISSVLFEEVTIMRSKSRHIIIFFVVFIIGIALFFFFTGRRGANEVEARNTDLSESKKYFTSIEIEEGDTLWEIADQYITSEYKDKDEYIEEVKEMNHITGSIIQTGSTLLIPYYE